VKQLERVNKKRLDGEKSFSEGKEVGRKEVIGEIRSFKIRMKGG
jgi:hypothetical protein